MIILVTVKVTEVVAATSVLVEPSKRAIVIYSSWDRIVQVSEAARGELPPQVGLDAKVSSLGRVIL